MKPALEGQSAIVTGGARGIGLGIARRLAAEGCSVALWDLDVATFDAAAAGFTPAPLQAVDVSDFAAVERAFAATEAALGKVDILVNNAGINGPVAPTWEYPLEAWDRVLAVDLTGVFYCCRAAAPRMRARGYGRIVNVASIAGKEGSAGIGAYAAAKAGVIGFTKTLARELIGSGVLVNAIAPVITETDLFKEMTPEHIADARSKIPMQRFLQIPEIAAMVAFVAGPECSFTTGFDSFSIFPAGARRIERNGRGGAPCIGPAPMRRCGGPMKPTEIPRPMNDATTAPGFRYLRLEREDAILTITIDRPEVLNSLHRDAHFELDRAFDLYAADPALRVAIITGTGERAFCVGTDSKSLATTGDYEIRRAGFAGITKRFDLWKPVIAAVNGLCLGGGVEIVAACDLAVASDHAEFALPEPRVGLAALGGGGLQRLARQMPMKDAMWLALTAKRIAASEARRISLVNEVAPRGTALDGPRRSPATCSDARRSRSRPRSRCCCKASRNPGSKPRYARNIPRPNACWRARMRRRGRVPSRQTQAAVARTLRGERP